MTIVNRFAFLVAALSLLSTVHADVFVAMPGRSDWTDPNSFSNKTAGAMATRVPGSSDTVQINENGTWSFTNDTAGAAAFNVMANVKEITFPNWIYPNLEIVVPGEEDEATINSAIHPQNDANCFRFFNIVKKGAGTLKLCSGATYINAAGAWSWGTTGCNYNFYANIRVREGAVRLLPSAPSTSCYVGLVDVSEGAKFYMPYAAAGGNFTCQTRGVKGAGTIVNDQTTSPTFDSMPTYSADDDLEPRKTGQLIFTGKFVEESTGSMHVRYSGPQYIKGTESTNKGVGMIWANSGGGIAEKPGDNAVTQIEKLGMSGQPSSFGMGSEIKFMWLGGTLWYTGTGETTDKAFRFEVPGEDNKLPIVFNAGPTGGVTFDGSDYTKTKWYANDTSGSAYAHDVRVILSGTNANPMRVMCPVKCGGYYLSSKLSTVLTPYFLKRGSGTWTFENDTSDMRGSFEIDEGTLGFTSIDETGYASSLGKSQNLYNFLDGKQTKEALDASMTSPFAVTLVGTNANANATLDYIGAKATGSADRKIGLAGFGGKIASNGEGLLLLNGVTVRDANLSTTLVLGGTNTSNNTLLNVTNGVGHIAVVKEDSGKWILSDDLDIDSIEVKGGTLVLERPTGLSYTWFKFIMMEARNWNLDGSGSLTTNAWPCIEEFILQDAEGNRVLTNPTSHDVAKGGTSSTENYRILSSPINSHGIGPNSIAYSVRGEIRGGGYNKTYILDDRLATNLFDNVKSKSAAGFWPSCWNGVYTGPMRDRPASWPAIIMRLPENAPHIDSCDLVAGTGGGWQNELYAWGLEGSRDGIHWETITNYLPSADAEVRKATQHRSGNEYWSLVDIYGRSTPAKTRWTPGETKAPEPNGYHFPGVVTNNTFAFPSSLSFVKISGGGTLRVDSTSPALTIDNVTVDATTGGTITNVMYAANGTLNLVNIGSERSITVPGRLYGFNKDGWTVNLPAGYENRIVDVKDGQITITKRGLVIVVQ